jgi:hypothetical protein
MKNKPLLNESTVRKFMKLANLGRVGQGFIAENYTQEEETLEEEESLEEDKHFGGTKDQKMKPLKTSKKNIVKEAEEEADMGMAPEAEPEMPEVPEVEPATEPTEMDASSLADQIIQVLQGAGLVDVVEDEDSDMEEPETPEVPEVEPEEDEDEEEEDETYMQEAKKRQLAKLVAERVQARLAREARIENLAESITKRVMERAKASR